MHPIRVERHNREYYSLTFSRWESYSAVYSSEDGWVFDNSQDILKAEKSGIMDRSFAKAFHPFCEYVEECKDEYEKAVELGKEIENDASALYRSSIL